MLPVLRPAMAVLLTVVLFLVADVLRLQAHAHLFTGRRVRTPTPEALSRVHSKQYNATWPDYHSHLRDAAQLVKRWRVPSWLPMVPHIYVGLDPALAPAGPAYQKAAQAYCDRLMGTDFLQQWQANKQHYCDYSIDPLAPEDVNSDIHCFLAPEINDGFPLSACMASNMVLENSTAFMGTSDRGMPDPPTTVCTPAYWNRFPRPLPGSIKVACQAAAVDRKAKVVPDISTQRAGAFAMVDHVATFMVAALQDRQYQAVADACGRNGSDVIEHPVLFVADYGTPNVYHSMESFTIALSFLAAHAADMARTGIQVVLVDNEDTQGPYSNVLMTLWQHISTAAPVRSLPHDPFPPNTCFRKAVVLPVAHYTSILKVGSHRQLLCRSSLAVGMASWVRQLARSGPGRPPQKFTILYVARNLHRQARPHIDFKDTEFYLQWQLYREIFNEQEVVDAIKTMALVWNEETCGLTQASLGKKHTCRPHVTFDVAVQHGHYPLQKQLNNVFGATIMVGVHGAGLTYAYFMPPGGAVLELMPGHFGGGANHYHSIANMVGHAYERSVYALDQRKANITDVTTKLLGLMTKLGACTTW